jgi:sialidase-1
MTLWSSTDAGRTFTKLHTLSYHPAGYSDLVQLDHDTIGILCETGAKGPYETIEFHRLRVP